MSVFRAAISQTPSCDLVAVCLYGSGLVLAASIAAF